VVETFKLNIATCVNTCRREYSQKLELSITFLFLIYKPWNVVEVSTQGSHQVD